jgi:site-specific DNA-cytosine methylase
MKSLELFSGAGGLAKGLELSGLKHSALVELNKHAYAGQTHLVIKGSFRYLSCN